MKASNVKNIVLVHGGFVDGSGWERVYAKPEATPSSRACLDRCVRTR